MHPGPHLPLPRARRSAAAHTRAAAIQALRTAPQSTRVAPPHFQRPLNGPTSCFLFRHHVTGPSAGPRFTVYDTPLAIFLDDFFRPTLPLGSDQWQPSTDSADHRLGFRPSLKPP